MYDVFIFVLLFYMCVWLHELGHFVGFIIQKIKVVAFYVFPIYIEMYDSTIRFKWNFFCFGQVIPKVPLLNNKNINIYRKKIQRNMLAGPCVNVILAIISGVMALITNNRYLWIIFFVNVFMIIQCGTVNRYVIGDFVAYYKIKREVSIFMRIIYTYYLQDTKNILENKYFFIKNGVEDQ